MGIGRRVEVCRSVGVVSTHLEASHSPATRKKNTTAERYRRNTFARVVPRWPARPRVPINHDPFPIGKVDEKKRKNWLKSVGVGYTGSTAMAILVLFQ